MQEAGKAASLTAALLRLRLVRGAQIVADMDSGCATGSGGVPKTPLFLAKESAAGAVPWQPAPARLPVGRVRAAPPRPRSWSHRSRLPLRFTSEQRMRVQLAAGFLRQSCQAFVNDAIDRYVADLLRDPANALLRAMLEQANVLDWIDGPRWRSAGE